VRDTWLVLGPCDLDPPCLRIIHRCIHSLILKQSFLLQDGSDSSKAIKTGLGLLAAAVATLIVSSFAVKEADQPMRGATTSSKSPNKSGWKLKRILGHVTNFAEGLLFSLALGLAGG
jgi:hypothetical protein